MSTLTPAAQAGEQNAERVSKRVLSAPRSRPNATTDLICFAHAGSGPSVFLSWSEHVAETIEVIGVQLPGREMRLNEPANDDLQQVVTEIGIAIQQRDTARSGKKRRLVFFGHSLGALLAFEVSRWLKNNSGSDPDLLIVAGRRAPEIPLNRPFFHNLNDVDLIEVIKSMGGTQHEIFENPRLVQWLMPILRADISMNDTYRFQQGPPIECPIVAVSGNSDSFASGEDIRRWESHAPQGFFDYYCLPGDHFFVHQEKKALLDIISRAIALRIN